MAHLEDSLCEGSSARQGSVGAGKIRSGTFQAVGPEDGDAAPASVVPRKRWTPSAISQRMRGKRIARSEPPGVDGGDPAGNARATDKGREDVEYEGDQAHEAGDDAEVRAGSEMRCVVRRLPGRSPSE